MPDERIARLAGLLEPAALEVPPDSPDRLGIGTAEMEMSQAISLKRIADALSEESPFLKALGGTLDDVSHNHQQRMRNL